FTVAALRAIKRSWSDPTKYLTNWNKGDSYTSNWTAVLDLLQFHTQRWIPTCQRTMNRASQWQRKHMGRKYGIAAAPLVTRSNICVTDYYNLPFCKPLEGIKDSAENLGELLMGDRIENSPYRFKMYTNETDLFVCRSDPSNANDFKILKERIDEMYQVNLLLENLPAIRYTKKQGYILRWTGYPVGIKVHD
ncbi:hypothetical protein IFM89_012248, partial [Coptis chinensis]